MQSQYNYHAWIQVRQRGADGAFDTRDFDVVLTADELELVINAVNYERHNNAVTEDYRVELENLEKYLTGQQVEA